MKRDFINAIAMLTIGLAAISWLVYVAFFEPQSNEITFKVIGLTNSPNASSLASLHFECIKYCSLHQTYPHDCYVECAKLGMEGCK